MSAAQAAPGSKRAIQRDMARANEKLEDGACRNMRDMGCAGLKPPFMQFPFRRRLSGSSITFYYRKRLRARHTVKRDD
eukprot:scaffold318836_cov33-Tisochrysis_lutea.AAC.1